MFVHQNDMWKKMGLLGDSKHQHALVNKLELGVALLKSMGHIYVHKASYDLVRPSVLLIPIIVRIHMADACFSPSILVQELIAESKAFDVEIWLKKHNIKPYSFVFKGQKIYPKVDVEAEFVAHFCKKYYDC